MANGFKALLLVILLAACSSGPPPTPTITATPLVRSTLPPTWTPTASPSPAPPSATPTATHTLTPQPTLSPDEICAGFEVLYEIPPGARYDWDKIIPLLFTLESPDVTARFLAVHRATGENQGLEIPGGQSFVFEFPVNWLPRPGVYDWTLGVHSPAYGDICTRSGTLTAVQPWLGAAPSATPAAEFTPEATAAP